jgi:hypothetical protein
VGRSDALSHPISSDKTSRFLKDHLCYDVCHCVVNCWGGILKYMYRRLPEGDGPDCAQAKFTEQLATLCYLPVKYNDKKGPGTWATVFTLAGWPLKDGGNVEELLDMCLDLGITFPTLCSTSEVRDFLTEFRDLSYELLSQEPSIPITEVCQRLRDLRPVIDLMGLGDVFAQGLPKPWQLMTTMVPNSFELLGGGYHANCQGREMVNHVHAGLFAKTTGCTVTRDSDGNVISSGLVDILERHFAWVWLFFSGSSAIARRWPGLAKVVAAIFSNPPDADWVVPCDGVEADDEDQDEYY